MASISSTSNNGNAWAAQAAERKAKLFAKTDTDGSGGVDSTELQTLMDKVSERTGVTNTRTAADLVTELDTDSNGSLDADELKNGIPSIVPLPSTMEFSQTRGAGGPPPGGPPPADAAAGVANGTTSTNGTDRIDINQLAQQVLRQYADIAAGLASKTTGTSLSVSA